MPSLFEEFFYEDFCMEIIYSVPLNILSSIVLPTFINLYGVR